MFTIFACGSKIWFVQRLLFVGQTESRNWILELHEFWNWLFLGPGHQVCQRIGTKLYTEQQLSNVYFYLVVVETAVMEPQLSLQIV